MVLRRWLYYCAVETSTLLACHNKISDRSSRNTWAVLFCGIGSRRPQRQTGLAHVFRMRIYGLSVTEFDIGEKYICSTNKKDMEHIPVKFYRQACIYKTIRQHIYIGLPELIGQVQGYLLVNGYDNGVSKRSIQRDIQEMNATWVSILYDKTRKGYYMPTDERVDTFVEHLLDNIALSSALKSTQAVSDYILLEQRPVTGTEFLPNILNALKNNLKIEFDYYKFTENGFTHRVVEPYFLKEFSGRWYLLAKAENETTVKTWALECVRNLSHTSEHFERPAQFDPYKMYEHAFGIYTNEALPVEEVVLSFTPKGGRYILTRPLHRSQVVLADDDKEIRIKLNIQLTNDFLMELLSQTDKMTVIAPEHLKQRLQDIYKRAIERMNQL